MIFNNCYA